MEVIKSYFPARITENELAYLKYLEAVINSIDIHATTEVTYKPTGYLVRIAPSHPSFLPYILKTIKTSHRELGIEVEFSKSIKSSSTITFIILNDKPTWQK